VNSGSVCNGQSFTITANGASTYTYSSGPVVTPSITTSYQVNGASSAGCKNINPAVSVVTVFQLPPVNVSTTHTMLCAGEEATLTAGGASTYTFDPGGISSGITITPTVNTSYTLTGVDSRGCTNTAVFTQSVDACSGFMKNYSPDAAGIKVFPNPAGGVLHIELDSGREIIMMNALGQTVYLCRFGVGIHDIDLANLPAGIYVVSAVNAVGFYGIKLLKE
jgi:hypothetical protein